jgi:hypothetical protein
MGNHNSGRRPQPAALKALRGNPSKTKLNQREPKPPPGEVVKPAEMSADASRVWDAIAPIAIGMGTLTPADVWAFKTLCELQASLDMAARAKSAPEFAPFTVSEDYNGAPKMGIHGALSLELRYAPIIRPYYEKFGIDGPTGRARMSIPGKKEPETKWAGVLSAAG